MGTQGSIVVGGQKYFIGHDSGGYRTVLKGALALYKKGGPESFIKIVNELGGDAEKGVPEDFGWPFEVYRWTVDLENKTVKRSMPPMPPGEKNKDYYKKLQKLGR